MQEAEIDRRILALEIIVRGEDGRNGMKSQLSGLCQKFDQFEKKMVRWVAIGTSLPGIVVAVIATLKFWAGFSCNTSRQLQYNKIPCS